MATNSETTTNISTISPEKRAVYNSLINNIPKGTPRVFLNIPVDMLTIDSSYQTDIRTNRPSQINRLAANWNEDKYEPLTVVPHKEDCMFYIVNGYGRWQASQKLIPPKGALTCTVLLGAEGKTPEERRQFECELFAYQDRETSRLQPIHTHGSRLVLNDEATLLLEKLRKKYHFSYVSESGNRSCSVLGSYRDTLRLCGSHGEECMNFIFDICRDGGFYAKTNGYARDFFYTFKDMFYLFPEQRNAVKQALAEKLRGREPNRVIAAAISKYQELSRTSAVTLYIEDIVVDTLNLQHVRRIENGRLVRIA